MGLALGIDYSLFVVSRYREERGRGLEKPEAITGAGATASRAVLFSGTAFVVAMTGMLLVPNNIMRSLALGAILVGIVSVVAALTLLPALLGLLGDRVNALRVPFLGRASIGQASPEGRFWHAIVQRVLRRPALSLTVAAAILIAVARPLFGRPTASPRSKASLRSSGTFRASRPIRWRSSWPKVTTSPGYERRCNDCARSWPARRFSAQVRSAGLRTDASPCSRFP
jgi:uncharacterized membrane protein YdfJ with MMPL/SSD domain